MSLETIIKIKYFYTGSSSLPPPVDLAGYFPYLPKDGSMSEEERSHHLSTLYRESEKIKKKFTSLMFNLQEDLEKNSTLDKVVNLLIFHNIPEDELCDCYSIALIFRRIRKYISFFDYELIKILSKHLGSSTLKKRFANYKLHFQEFAKRHICECPHDLFGEPEITNSAGEKREKIT